MDQEQLANEVKDQLVQQYMKNGSTRAVLAASMTQPLRTRRDYTAQGRKAFLVEQLPDGALALYDKDVYVKAYYIGEDGEGIMSQTKGERVIFPLFLLTAVPTVKITEVKERRFDIVERMIDQAKAEIQKKEDDRVFNVLNEIALEDVDPVPEGSPFKKNDVLTGTTAVDKDILIDQMAQIHRHDLPMDKWFMNAKDHADLLKFGRDVYDPQTQQDLIKTGLQGNLWGAKVMVTRTVPVGRLYALSTPEFVGRIPVRMELTMLSADSPRDFEIGFSAFEQIGIGAHNPLGVSIYEVTRS